MRPIDTVLIALAEKSEEIVTHVVGRIRAEVPGYAELPYDEHFRDSEMSIRNIIDGVRNGVPPAAGAVEYARMMGRNRARIHLPLNEGIDAYHIAYREIWNELLTRAARYEPDLTSELVGEVTLLWNWFHRLSSAFSDAYAEEARTMVSAELSLRKRFVEALTAPAWNLEEASGLAQSLGFDPEGDFVALAATSRGDADIDRINSALTKAPGTAHCAEGPAGTAVVVAQARSEVALVSGVQQVSPHSTLGVGMTRTGVVGAAASLVDAAEALEHARTTRRTTYFAEDWLLSSLLGKIQRLAPILAVGIDVAAAHPALAETVRSYVGNRYSASACARALHVHPNSVKYRLERWKALTGWDVDTFDGLVRSMICLEMPAFEKTAHELR